MKDLAIAEILRVHRRECENYRSGVFTRIGHHNKTRDRLLRYIKAIEIAASALRSAPDPTSIGTRKRICERAIREMMSLIVDPKKPLEDDDDL